MKIYLNSIFFLFLIVLQDACQPVQKRPKYIYLTGNAQGTTFNIKYRDSLQLDVTKQVDSLFKLIDRSMSLWDSTSAIVKFNENQLDAANRDEHFIAVFKRSQYISETTGGSFDATVAPLVRRWGFHFKKNQTPPDDTEIQEILKCVGWQKIKWDGTHFSKESPCLQLDFNAIAQGYTVDLIAQFLENQGIKDYMVEIGGEVRAAGKNEHGEIWRIGIDQPQFEKNPATDAERPLQEIVTLNNHSIATSGNYRKFIEKEGKRYSHTIDPATGKPVQHHLLSVSVMTKNCSDADAFATAFMVLGLEKSKILAEKLGLAVLFIFENEEGKLETAKVGSLAQD